MKYNLIIIAEEWSSRSRRDLGPFGRPAADDQSARTQAACAGLVEKPRTKPRRCMSSSVRDVALLRRLGDGEALSSVAASQGWTTETMCTWFARTASKRVAPYLMVFSPSRGRVPTEADVRIERDAEGVPHVTGGSAADCAFGYGWCMSEDRLFQLDVLRRKATGGCARPCGPAWRPWRCACMLASLWI